MKNILTILSFLLCFNGFSQSLYIPSNPDSIKVPVNVNGAVRTVYNIDLVKYRAALTARDTAAALRLLIAANTSNIATNTTNISANTTAIGLKADKSATISINGTLQTLGSNPSFTVTSAASDTTKAVQTKYLGQLYNKNSWTDLSDFTTNGTTPTVTGNKMQFTGGAGNFTQTLDISRYTTLEKWIIGAKFLVGAKTTTSYGVGVGIRSTNTTGLYNVTGRIDLSTNGTGGQLIINAGSGNTSVATSTTNLTVTTGDYVVITLERNGDMVTLKGYNATTKSAPVSVSYQYSFASTATILTPNTGRFAIYNLGGTQTLDSLSVYSNEKKYNDIAIVGDSKTAGYYASAFSSRYASLLGTYFNTTVLAGGSDKTGDVLNRLQEIIDLAPKYVLLNIGRNDIGFGVAQATMFANYDTITARLTRAGIRVVHLLPIYETSVTQTPLTSHITSTFSASDIIDSKMGDYAGTATSVLATDNVHPNATGHQKIFESILKADVLKNAGQSNSGSIFPIASQGSVYFSAGGTAPTTNPTLLSADNTNSVVSIGGGITQTGNVITQTVNTATPLRNQFINTNAGAATYSEIAIGQSTNFLDQLRLVTTSSGFTAVSGGPYASDGAVVEAAENLSGGLGISALAAAGSIRFYTNYSKTAPGVVDVGRFTAAGNFLVNSNTDNSKLTVGGSVAFAYVAKTAAYTATINDYTIDCNGTFTVTIPTAVGITGRIYIIKNSGTGTITLAGTSAQTFDGASSPTIATQYGILRIQSNGANWIVL